MIRKTATRRWGTGLRATVFVLLFVLPLAAVQGRALAVPALQPAGDQEALPQNSPAEDGEALFQSTCFACHTIGGGDGVGPDLQGVTTRREEDWLSRWILNPAVMISDGDPIATELLAKFNNVAMPTLGLSEVEVASVIAFLTEQDGGDAESVASQVTAGEGDAVAGKNLFTGVTRLSNGGPSCRACHSSAGIGGLGGGKLGPDLTGAYLKLGDVMILWPETSQTMQPIFSSKPLTPDEKVDLLAFFSSTDVTKRSTEVIGQLIVLAVVGVVVIAVLAQLIWRRRLSAVRVPMVSSQRERD